MHKQTGSKQNLHMRQNNLCGITKPQSLSCQENINFYKHKSNSLNKGNGKNINFPLKRY